MRDSVSSGKSPGRRQVPLRVRNKRGIVVFRLQHELVGPNAAFRVSCARLSRPFRRGVPNV